MKYQHVVVRRTGGPEVLQIAEGRSAAAAVDRFLGGKADLPVPIPPTARPLA